MQYKFLCSLTLIVVLVTIGPSTTQAQPLVNDHRLVELGEIWLTEVRSERRITRVAETAWWTTEAIRLNIEARRLKQLESALTILDSELEKLASAKLGFFDYLIGIVADALDDADGYSDWSFVEEVERFEFTRTATSAIQTQFQLTWSGRLENEKVQLRHEWTALKENLDIEGELNLLNEIPQEVLGAAKAKKIQEEVGEFMIDHHSEIQRSRQNRPLQQEIQAKLNAFRQETTLKIDDILATHESALSSEEKELRKEIIALVALEAGFPAIGLPLDAYWLETQAVQKFIFVMEEEGLEVEWSPMDAVLLSFANGAALLARGAELLGYIEQGFWTNPLPTLGSEWVELAEIIEEQAKRVEQIVEWLAEKEIMEVEEEMAMVHRIGRIADEARTAGIDNAGLVAKQSEVMKSLLEGRAKRERIEAERWNQLLEDASRLVTEAKWLAIEGRRLVEREAFVAGIMSMEGRSNLDAQAGRLGVMASRIAEQIIRYMN